MPSNMALPMYTDKRKTDGARMKKQFLTNLLHIRIFFMRYRFIIALVLILAIGWVLFFSGHLPTPNPDLGPSGKREPHATATVEPTQKQDLLTPVVEKPEPTRKENDNPVNVNIGQQQEPDKDKQDAEEARQEEIRKQAEAERQAESEKAAAEEQQRREEQRKAQEEQSKGGVKGEASPERQGAVKAAFLHAWNSYRQRAWGYDELKPRSQAGLNWLSTGLGATIVDGLATMHVMALTEEFKAARDWVETELPRKISEAGAMSFFECTIRILGGLLSAHDLTGDAVFLDRAKMVADRLVPAFRTPTGIPRATVNFRDGSASSHGWTRGNSILAEVGTIQMEFCTLAKKLNDSSYCDAAMQVLVVLTNAAKPRHGLYPFYINADSGAFNGQQVSLGALGDSFYEYLLKMYVLTKQNIPRFKELYVEQSNLIASTLVRRNNHYTYLAEIAANGNLDPKMDHLACFAAGMFALGAHIGIVDQPALDRHWNISKELTETCYHMYADFPLGISPESVRFTDEKMLAHGTYYILRPEVVESIFVLWRMTHNPIYREHGWKIFSAIDHYCRSATGFCVPSGLRDVTTGMPTQDDQQQSFFLAETLKYLYLLFSEDELISLDEYVFNTEAHPFKIWKEPYSAYAQLFNKFAPAPLVDQVPVQPPKA